MSQVAGRGEACLGTQVAERVGFYHILGEWQLPGILSMLPLGDLTKRVFGCNRIMTSLQKGFFIAETAEYAEHY
jgi:hypothetical protein